MAEILTKMNINKRDQKEILFTTTVDKKQVAISEKSVYTQKQEQAATYDVVGARPSCI